MKGLDGGLTVILIWGMAGMTGKAGSGLLLSSIFLDVDVDDADGADDADGGEFDTSLDKPLAAGEALDELYVTAARVQGLPPLAVDDELLLSKPK